MSDHKDHDRSRRYLSLFMLVPALLFFCHFLYFANFPDWYVWFDIPLQLFGIMVFPLYHIYFRLLTVDDEISFRKYILHLVLPLTFVILYGIAVFNSSLPEYKAWLFNKIDSPGSPSVQFLQILRVIMKMIFCAQVIFYTIANHRLINRYSDRAIQFYSDLRDAQTNYAKMLNLSIVASGVVTLVVVAVGRTFLMSQDFLIFFAWLSITVTLYFIGYLGARQKVINPDVLQDNSEPVQLFNTSVTDQEVLVNKILLTFVESKLYLNNDLTIQDLAKTVGTNRTYLSTVINQNFNLNFCTFVNGFRVNELERVILETPDYLLVQYVVLCGFGSVNSMKRSVTAITGMSFHDFRSSVLMKKRA